MALLLVAFASHSGYLLLAALVAAESVGLPVPGETALIAAALVARHGGLEIWLVIVIAAAGAIAGDNVGYVVGRKGGRRLLERPGPLQERRRRILAKGEPFFQRHGAKAVFLGRWVSGLRIAAAWLAGIERMPWRVFVLWNALGGIAWATTVGLAAYLLGPAAERIVKDIGIGGVAAVAAAGGGYAVWRLVRRGRT